MYNRILIHAHPDHTLDVVMLKLGRNGFSQLPVVSRTDTTKLLGMITMHDVTAALAKAENVNESMGSDIENPDE